MLVHYYQLPRRDMVYLKFVMEAHEGLATLSTADKLEGTVRIAFSEEHAPTVESLLDALQKEISLKRVLPAAGSPEISCSPSHP